MHLALDFSLFYPSQCRSDSTLGRIKVRISIWAVNGSQNEVLVSERSMSITKASLSVMILKAMLRCSLLITRPCFTRNYCLTKISIRANRSISRVFSLFIVSSPFLYIARTKAVLTGLKAY